MAYEALIRDATFTKARTQELISYSKGGGGATAECDAALLEVLFQAGASLNAKAQSGRSPLGEAVRLRELETCRLLVAARADINAHLPGEESLLHVALPLP